VKPSPNDSIWDESRQINEGKQVARWKSLDVRIRGIELLFGETFRLAIVLRLGRAVNGKSYPIQDEPEGEMGFQYKMSLERMAC